MEMWGVNNCSYLQLMAFDRTRHPVCCSKPSSVLKHNNENFIDFQRGSSRWTCSYKKALGNVLMS